MSKKTTANRQERDAIKSCLQQYHMANQKRRILEERRRTLSAELRGPYAGAAFKAAPISRPVHHDGAGAVVLKIAEVEERIEKQQEEMAETVLRVMNLIELLPPDSTERTVVEMRHIDCHKWERIARDMHMSKSRVIDYYNAALEMLAANEAVKIFLNSCGTS